MLSPKSILLRFESKDGQFRLTVNPTDQFTSLLSRVSSFTHQGNPAVEGSYANSSAKDLGQRPEKCRLTFSHLIEQAFWRRGSAPELFEECDD